MAKLDDQHDDHHGDHDEQTAKVHAHVVSSEGIL